MSNEIDQDVSRLYLDIIVYKSHIHTNREVRTADE